MTDTIYTSVGSSALTAINPHKYVASNANLILQKYTAGYRDMAENKAPLPPHIFQLKNMRHAPDQSLVIRYGPIFFTPSVVYECCVVLVVKLAVESQKVAALP